MTTGTIPTGTSAPPLAEERTTEHLLRIREQLPVDHPDREALRGQAIEQNLPMAYQLARRYAGRRESVEDLRQVAALALIAAVDRYDSQRAVPFAGYAVPTILGALRRYFRDTAWAIRIPRAAQETVLELRPATDDLIQRHGREPTSAELADHLKITVEDLRFAISASQVYRLASLDYPCVRDDGIPVMDLLGSDDPHYAEVDEDMSRHTLESLIVGLAHRDQWLLRLRFQDGMTQDRIAAELGLSQMHVSRMLKRVLDRLRDGLVASSADQ